MEVRSNVGDQLNRMNRRVAAVYGMTVVYILFAKLITVSMEDMAIRAILTAGGILLLIRAVRIDIASWDEADKVPDQLDKTPKAKE